MAYFKHYDIQHCLLARLLHFSQGIRGGCSHTTSKRWVVVRGAAVGTVHTLHTACWGEFKHNLKHLRTGVCLVAFIIAERETKRGLDTSDKWNTAHDKVRCNVPCAFLLMHVFKKQRLTFSPLFKEVKWTERIHFQAGKLPAASKVLPWVRCYSKRLAPRLICKSFIEISSNAVCAFKKILKMLSGKWDFVTRCHSRHSYPVTTKLIFKRFENKPLS